MDKHKEKYTSFLTRLVMLTHVEPFDREPYKELIKEICEEYRLAKGVTEFYTTPMKEQRGDGEIFCDFDNGKGDKILLRRRIESSTKAVIVGTLYCDSHDEPHTPDEIDELDILFRIIIGFVSRMRLLRVVEEFGFKDMYGFNNYRAFARYLDSENYENRLGGKIAFHMDLHNFTMVNQEIGREKGDLVILRFYEKLQDVIGDNGIVSRLGGDKFIGIFDRKIKRNVYEVFSGATITYDDENDKKIDVTAAAGVYMLPNPYAYRGPGDIMDKIMIASNTAKRQTEGSIVVYDDKMKSARNHVKKIRSDFRTALDNEEFAVYYQPKVNIETQEIIGAEALCRWVKDRTIIPPNDFIPILEMNTDICDLDFYMLEHVCADIRRWLDEGKEVVRVSVNLSRKHLVDVELLDHIISVVDKYKVPHEYIEVELTETTTDVLFSDLKRVVCGLQEQGIWTAVDDFGVGFSSLNLIRDIPWNVLKIDRSFVPKDDEAEDSVSNKMFKHVIALAYDLGIKCVIEGVETVDQLEVLRRNNCLVAQGYFFDRPLPLEEFESRLEQKCYNLSI